MAGTRQRCLFATVALLTALTAVGCSSPSRYDGTVVIGANYVQALVTAPGDTACPPRVQRPGVCVRTPAAGAACTKAPACVTELKVKPSGSPLAVADSSFVRLPSLDDAADDDAARLTAIEIDGCGGKLRHEHVPGPVVRPFSTATATVSASSIQLQWSPKGDADLVCALWTGSGIKEVCCGKDTGSLTVKLREGDQVEHVYLSRGHLVDRQRTAGGTVEFFRTAETSSLTPE